MTTRRDKLEIPAAADCLPGRAQPISVPTRHYVNHNPMLPPYPEGFERLIVGLGCFWGAERKFWQIPGVHVTAAGYAGGTTPNPSYEEVCSGRTGHTEVVQIIYDPAKISTASLLKLFWEAHNPTQGMRQGNDVGTQYRSAIYTDTKEQMALALATKAAFQEGLTARRLGAITTEIAEARAFYFAEAYHQQYLAKHPNGYCGLAGTGVTCPIPA